jgi:hypothetical protein
MSRSKQSKTYFNSDVKISVGLCLDPYIAKLISALMPNSALDNVEAETRLFEAQAAQNRFRPCVNKESQAPYVANLCSRNRRT